VTHLVEVDPAEQVEYLTTVLGEGQGILPVLDLRFAAEQSGTKGPLSLPRCDELTASCPAPRDVRRASMLPRSIETLRVAHRVEEPLRSVV